MNDISKILNKDFICSKTGEVYSIHFSLEGDFPEYWSKVKFGVPFARDSNGNLFTESKDKKIYFWDHETDDLHLLAKDFEEFERDCSEPQPIEVELKEGQVKSAWMDPEFAKTMGIDVPKDGWIKRPIKESKWKFWKKD